MGQRGPAKTPSAISDLRGNPGKRAKNKGEPQFGPLTAKCPSWLGKEGKKVWRRLTKVLAQVPGLLMETDAEALAQYCQAWDDFFAAQVEIQRYGLLIESAKGTLQRNPADITKEKAIARINRIGAKFGLTPADRAGLDLTADVPEEDDFAKLLSRGATLN